MEKPTSPPIMSTVPAPKYALLARRSGWTVTRATSVVLTALAAVVLIGMLVLFTIESLPVWNADGWGYVSGKKWFSQSRTFGALPMIYGSAVVAGIALLLATPIGIGAALLTAEFLPPRARTIVKVAIELLAGIPSVVYGLLGILLLRNYVYDGLDWFGFDPLNGDTLLTAGLLLAIMVLPTIMTLSDDALRSVPSMSRHAARGLGLTHGQTILAVSLPQARKGLIAAVLLAFGRALGETIAVFLVVGRQDNQLPRSLLDFEPVINSGQTLTSKLGGPEVNIAYGNPLHWAAIVGLGLLLLMAVTAVTLLAAVLQRGGSSGERTRIGDRVASVGHSALMAIERLFFATVIGRWRARLIHWKDVVSRSFFNWIVGGVSTACGMIACVVLAWVIGAILFRGLPAVTWRFLTEQIRLVGAEGGIFYNLVGTAILMATAAVVTTPLSISIALMQGFYLRSPSVLRAVTLLLYVLNGVPSMLFGIFGLIVFVKYLDWGKSWLAGGILLGLMITPTVSVALLERIRMIPVRYIEAATGLGLTQSQIVRSVVLPQSLGGLVTGLLLGLARAAGETAPIMFTATISAGATFPSGIIESPVLALPYHIFLLAQDSYGAGITAKVWGSATVLLGLVFILSLISLPIRLRVHEEARNA